MDSKKSLKEQIISNALQFLFCIAFVITFQMLFGSENVLPSVALSVGLTMFPKAYNGVRLKTMIPLMFMLYMFSGIVAETVFLPIPLAFILNFLFLVVIMITTCEPEIMKPSISFLLCFIFSESTPVPIASLPNRLLCLLVGSFIVMITTFIYWKKEKKGSDGRTLKEQVKLCLGHKNYIFRMSLGVSIAMLVGLLFHLKKPLWISIVVMSLTQVDFDKTWERLKHRSIATFVGIFIFIVVFNFIIPPKYALLFTMFLNYLTFFTPEYKYKQIVNAICAINASLVLLDTVTAVENRVLCLFGGAMIVLLMWAVQHPVKKIHYHVKRKRGVWFTKEECIS